MDEVIKAFEKVGIASGDDYGEPRAFTEMIDELAEKWDDLEEHQRYFLAFAIFQV